MLKLLQAKYESQLRVKRMQKCDYSRALERIVSYFGDLDPKLLTRPDVISFKKERQATVKELAIGRAFYSWMQKEGYVTVNPFRCIR